MSDLPDAPRPDHAERIELVVGGLAGAVPSFAEASTPVAPIHAAVQLLSDLRGVYCHEADLGASPDGAQLATQLQLFGLDAGQALTPSTQDLLVRAARQLQADCYAEAARRENEQGEDLSRRRRWRSQALDLAQEVQRSATVETDLAQALQQAASIRCRAAMALVPNAGGLPGDLYVSDRERDLLAVVLAFVLHGATSGELRAAWNGYRKAWPDRELPF